MQRFRFDITNLLFILLAVLNSLSLSLSLSLPLKKLNFEIFQTENVCALFLVCYDKSVFQMNMFKTMANNAYIDVIFLLHFHQQPTATKTNSSTTKTDKTKNNDKIAYTSIESITKFTKTITDERSHSLFCITSASVSINNIGNRKIESFKIMKN